MLASIPRTSYIPRGTPGNVSLLKQHMAEFDDSVGQKNPIAALHDLAGLVGASKAWLKRNHPTITLNDLERMADAAAQAVQPEILPKTMEQARTDALEILTGRA